VEDQKDPLSQFGLDAIDILALAAIGPQLRGVARAATLKPFGCHTPMTKAGPVGLSTAASLHAMLSLKGWPHDEY
jgi:hypothetical protein